MAGLCQDVFQGFHRTLRERGGQNPKPGPRPETTHKSHSLRCFQLARMGIIDFLVHWDVRKRTESALKRTCLHPRHTERVTIMDPETYKRRQLAFLMAMFRNTA